MELYGHCRVHMAVVDGLVPIWWLYNRNPDDVGPTMNLRIAHVYSME